jgi:[ribosomal protein S5]-alanine N-acetyltransferase
MEFEILETNRLFLKGISPEGMNYIFENHSQDEIMYILGHGSNKDFEVEKNKYKQGYSTYNRRFVLFLLIDKESEIIIGRCGLHNWNPDHYRAEIGYSMEVESFKQMGYMSEAVEAIIKFGFEKLKLHRIEAMTATYNTPSLQLLRKNKFVQEGLLREHYLVGDIFEDSIVFSLLQKEYFKN